GQGSIAPVQEVSLSPKHALQSFVERCEGFGAEVKGQVEPLDAGEASELPAEIDREEVLAQPAGGDAAVTAVGRVVVLQVDAPVLRGPLGVALEGEVASAAGELADEGKFAGLKPGGVRLETETHRPLPPSANEPRRQGGQSPLLLPPPRGRARRGAGQAAAGGRPEYPPPPVIGGCARRHFGKEPAPQRVRGQRLRGNASPPSLLVERGF